MTSQLIAAIEVIVELIKKASQPKAHKRGIRHTMNTHSNIQAQRQDVLYCASTHMQLLYVMNKLPNLDISG